MDTKAIIPIPDAPLVYGDRITEVWFRFLLQIFNRTGGGEGSDITRVLRDISDLQQSIESQDFGAAIASLQSALVDAPADVPSAALIDSVAARLADMEALNDPNGAQVVFDSPPEDVFTHGSLEGGALHSLATATVAGFMSSADKSKIDLLPATFFSPVSLTSDVVAQNTTADVNVFSTILPANSLAVGTTFSSSFTLLASAAAASGTISIWVKLGATKILNATFTVPLGGLTNQPLVSFFRWTVRTVGAAGTLQVSGNNNGSSTLFTSGIVVNTALANINTTIANTMSIGVNWSVANAGNVARAKTGLMEQER
jgi:hypothetical protein